MVQFWVYLKGEPTGCADWTRVGRGRLVLGGIGALEMSVPRMEPLSTDRANLWGSRFGKSMGKLL